MTERARNTAIKEAVRCLRKGANERGNLLMAFANINNIPELMDEYKQIIINEAT